MIGVTEGAAVEIGGVLIEGATFAVGVVIVAGLEDSGLIDDFPDTAEMVKLMSKAVQRIPAERLWVNPDCGLKTRAWPETEAALVNMVAAARQLRGQLA